MAKCSSLFIQQLVDFLKKSVNIIVYFLKCKIMPQENENVFIAESQSLDVDKQQKKDILDVIESCSSFQETIKQLEEKI
nr:hypothetical protein [Wolbachia endosymbiont of Glossina morsitans morsitans]